MPTHVLVAMDASPQARKALEFALSTFADATITVLHVSNPVDGAFFAGEEAMYVDVEELERRADETADRIFDTARQLADERNVPLETVTEVGQPSRTIVDYADDHDVDHVVVGSHGRSGVARVLLGSVAELVVRRSPVPVTVVH